MRYGDFEYEQIGSAIEITRYTGIKSNVEIPEKINNLPVISIGQNAFWNSSLEGLKIPNSIEKISESAFIGCNSLTSITIPNSVTKIGACAFLCCRSLKNIKIPYSIAEIGERAFEDCNSLTSIAFPRLNNICTHFKIF